LQDSQIKYNAYQGHFARQKVMPGKHYTDNFESNAKIPNAKQSLVPFLSKGVIN